MDRRKVLLIVAAVVAALGATMVFFYARGAENRAADKYETVDVLVVTQAIKPGDPANDAASAGKIVLKAIPRNLVLAGATADGKLFQGKFALQEMYPGEQLIPEKFGAAEDVLTTSRLPVPDGLFTATITLSDAARIAGFVGPGSRVGMLITGTFEGDPGQSTRVLLPDVLVLATGSTTTVPVAPADPDDPDAPPAPEALPITLYTFAGTEQEIKKIQLGSKLGEITLTLAGGANTKLKTGDIVDPGNLFPNKG